MQQLASKTTYGTRTNSPAIIQVSLEFGDFSATELDTIPNALWFSNDVTDAVNPRRAFRGCVAHVDLTQKMTELNLTDIQSVYVDNSINPGMLQLFNTSTQQIIVCPPYSQGTYPIFSVPGARSSNWTVVVADRIYTAELPSFGEPSAGITAPIMQNSAAVPRQAFLVMTFTDVPVPPATWTLHDRMCRTLDISGVIAAPNVFQTLNGAVGTSAFAALSTNNRRGFLVQNPGDAIEPLFLELHTALNVPTAANTIWLMPGDLYRERGDDTFAGLIQVAAATAGHAYTAHLFW